MAAATAIIASMALPPSPQDGSARLAGGEVRRGDGTVAEFRVFMALPQGRRFGRASLSGLFSAGPVAIGTLPPMQSGRPGTMLTMSRKITVAI